MQPCSSAVMVLRPPPQTTCEQRRMVVSWKNYSCEQAAGWPEPEGQSPSRWDVTDLHITTMWETVRKCQALFVTQHLHFPHKRPPEKTGARDVSPVWPLPWTLPLYQRSPGSPRGLHQVLREKHGVREPLFRKVTLFHQRHPSQGDGKCARQDRALPWVLGPQRDGAFCSSPASTPRGWFYLAAWP